jgi:hypothetical protein
MCLTLFIGLGLISNPGHSEQYRVYASDKAIRRCNKPILESNENVGVGFMMADD